MLVAVVVDLVLMVMELQVVQVEVAVEALVDMVLQTFLELLELQIVAVEVVVVVATVQDLEMVVPVSSSSPTQLHNFLNTLLKPTQY